MPELTLGISPCPNDVYVFSGLLLGHVQMPGATFDVDFQDVETLNARAQAGAMDVVKISYANYAHCRDRYDLLPCGGRWGGVSGRCCCRTAAGGMQMGKFWCQVNSRRPTSAGLLRGPPSPQAVPAVRRPVRPAPPDSGRPGRGDPRKAVHLRGGRPGSRARPGRLLGTRDGLRHPARAIAARRGLDTDALASTVRESLRWAYAHDGEAFALCRQHAQDLNPDVVRAHIRLYVNDFTNDVGSEGQAAVDFFLARQAVRVIRADLT